MAGLQARRVAGRHDRTNCHHDTEMGRRKCQSMQHLQHIDRRGNRQQRKQRPADDCRRAADQQEAPGAPAAETSRKPEQRHLDQHAERPQAGDRPVTEAQRTPIERAERVIGAMGCHDHAGGEDRPSQNRIAEGPPKACRSLRLRHVAHERQKQRRNAAGKKGDHLQGENARPADPADHLGGSEITRNEGDRSPQPHAGIIEAMPAHTGNDDGIAQRYQCRPEDHRSGGKDKDHGIDWQRRHRQEDDRRSCRVDRGSPPQCAEAIGEAGEQGAENGADEQRRGDDRSDLRFAQPLAGHPHRKERQIDADGKKDRRGKRRRPGGIGRRRFWSLARLLRHEFDR